MIYVKSNMRYCQPAVMFLKSTPGESINRSVENRDQNNPSEEEQVQEKRVILCAFCANTITDESQVISVNGSHRHVFVNPHGLVFDTGCFKECSGCIVDFRASVEFSWFHGYSWRIAACSRCHQHLGWLFSSNHADLSSSAGSFSSATCRSMHNSFYCLILENLIFP